MMNKEYNTQCYACGLQEKRPCYIGFFNSKDVFSCDKHYKELYDVFIKRKRPTNSALGQVIEKWTDPEGKTRRITHGKAWEIKNRRLSPEDKMTVVNYATGKEAQY